MRHQGAAQCLQPQRIAIGEQMVFVLVNRFIEAMLEVQVRKHVQIGRSRSKINRPFTPAAAESSLLSTM